LISIIKETNIDIENIKLNVSGNGCEWSVFVVLKPTQDGFVYQYSSTQERYASKSYASALQFLNNRNIKNILNSDDYKREHEKYIEEQASKDLPSVN
jgi:aspartyl/asparaginyl-tRNA synthetase